MNRRDLLAGAGLLLAVPDRLMAGGPDDEALETAIADYYRVYFQVRDEAGYRRLLADDYVLLEDGELMSAEEDIAAMPKKGAFYERSDSFDFRRSNVAGEFGYLIYFLTSSVRDESGSKTYRWLESAIYRRSGRGWLLSVLHSTKIDPAGS
jgi:Domain of unknown function (DUF4440)